jgi:hypothetical protein
MGEARRKKSATAAFIERHPNCYFCGGRRRAVTREHMPPKSLFDNSHRPDKLVMPACDECNRGTSTADLVASIIARWDYRITSVEHQDHKKLVARLRKQAPQIIEEWLVIDPIEKERRRRHLRNHGIVVPHDAGVASIGPLTIRQLNLFAHKTALALHFEHAGQPLPMTGRASGLWKSKEDFARDGVPPSLLSLLPEYRTLIQGKWNERLTFEYRYAINNEHGLFAYLAKFRRGLYVAGFTVTDASVIMQSDPVAWMAPEDAGVLLEDPRFARKI